MYTVKTLVAGCHQWAPPTLAESYDNVGLLIGDPSAEVSRVLCALDLNEAVVDEAINLNVQCIVTHHPFIFKALKSIDVTTPQGRCIQKLLMHNMSLVAMHTNLDIATGGINDYLAEQIGLTSLKILKPTSSRALYKIVVYVPQTHLHQVRDALIAWNPTKIGNYKGCTFSSSGTGTFIPLEGSKPAVGTEGQCEHVDEVRLEWLIDSKDLQECIACIKKVHPYEEIAYDVFKLEHMQAWEGIGRYGVVPQTTLDDFIEHLKKVFHIPYVRVTSSGTSVVERVAICSGSGSSFIQDAARVADVYITGDMTFHMAQEAIAQGLTVIDVGHYASEHLAIPLIKNYLEAHFEALEVYCSEVDGEVFEVR